MKRKRGGWPFRNPPNTQFNINRQCPQAYGLVAWWPFLGSFGAAVLRDRARTHNSSNFDGTSWGTSRLGPALVFNGSTDRVDIANIYDVSAKPLTIAAWIYPRNLSALQYLFCTHDSGDTVQTMAFWTDSTGTGRLELWIDTDGSSGLARASSDNVLTINTWQHVAVTWDGGTSYTGIHIYVNGTEVSYSGFLTPNGSVGASTGSHSFCGRIPDDNRNFDTKLVEMRLYDWALSATEVWQLYAPSTRYELFAPVIPVTLVRSPSVTVTPSVQKTTWTLNAPTVKIPAMVTPSVQKITWTLQTPTVGIAVTISPSTLETTWTLKAPRAATALELAQWTTGGVPVATLAIGSHTLDAYVISYVYEEEAQRSGSLALWLDNRDGNFDDLANDWTDLKRGAAVDLRRGLSIEGVDTTEKLPRTWIDSIQYVHDDGAGMLLLGCIDWWGLLENFRYGSAQTWSATNIKTIAAAVLTQVGLTVASGAFGFSVDHDIDTNQDTDRALRDLMDKVEEFFFTGLDGEIQFKTLDPGESAGYAYAWDGTGHPLLAGTEIAESSAEYNRITVNGSGAFTDTAEGATEISLVGTRQRTIADESLGSDAQCLERATAELSFWQSRRVAGTLVARPHFTLRLYDVVSVAAPPWGGPALSAARVTGIVERYGFGEWEQEIRVGDLPEQSLLHTESRPGRGRKSSASRKRKKRQSTGGRGSSRKSYSKREHTHDTTEITSGAGSGLVPTGTIVIWSGSVASIPSGWALCNGSNGTPDLRDSFVVAAGGSYAVGDSGGQDTANIRHRHGPGSLGTDSDSHSHGPGTLGTDSDGHTHTLAASEQTEGPDATRLVDINLDGSTVAVGDEDHKHDVDTVATDTDNHNHSVDTGSTASDSHSHDVDSGLTDYSGDSSYDNRPVYYALAFIMKL